MKRGRGILLVIVVALVIIGIGVLLFFVLERSVNEQDAGVDVSFENEYECGFDFYNCDSFDSSDEAQDVFDFCGGIDNDIHGLDRDKDGIVCEGMVGMG